MEATQRTIQPRRAMGGRTGMTLVEMIVALALFAVVSAVVVGFLTDSRGSYRKTRDLAQDQQTLRAVLSLMTREIRGAGCDSLDIGLDGIAMADDIELRCIADLNGDGTTLDAGEDITYLFDPGPLELRRLPGGGPDQTLLSARNHLQSVSFAYFDRQGQRLVNTPLNAADRRRIRLVEITITMLREGDANHPVDYTAQAHVRNFRPEDGS